MEEKRTLKSRFENFWYFYKWQTIVISILAIGILVAIFQMIGMREGDVKMLVVSPKLIDTAGYQAMQTIAEEYIDDANGDGIKYMNIIQIVANTANMDKNDPYTWQNIDDALKQFDTETTMGQSTIYILDEFFFERIKERGFLARLSDVNGSSVSASHDGYGIRLENLEFFEQEGYNQLPKNLVLCIRISPENDDFKHGRTVEEWQTCCKFIREIIKYKNS